MYSVLAHKDTVRETAFAQKASALHILAEVNDYYHELQTLRAGLSPERWREFCGDFVPGNLTRELTHHGPITRAYFEKRRGYAGDPESLDLIYSKGCAGDELTDLARILFSWESKLVFAESIRARREFAALELQEVCEFSEKPRILAIGAGHLREAEKLLGSNSCASCEFVAVDDDPLALQFLRQRFAAPCLHCVQTRPQQLARTASRLGFFDFIYSLNAFDRLHFADAERLIRTMFSMLAPGGRLLIANYAPDLPDAAYVEACMDWRPVYRTEEVMTELAHGIPERQIGGQVTFRDDWYSTVFLEVEASFSR